MTGPPSVDDLVSRWHQEKAHGLKVSPEELCADCPQLLPELRRRVDALAHMEALLETDLPRPQPTPATPFHVRPPTVILTSPPQLPLTPEDEFRLLRQLGEGGMGTVYEAEDRVLQRRVALKVMRPHLAASPSSRERFLREARAMAAVEHERIVPIHRVGEMTVDGRPSPYLVMPLLKGQSLRDRLTKGPRPSLGEVRQIGRQIAEGLAVALLRPPPGDGGMPAVPIKGDLDVLIWEKGNKRRQNIRLGDTGALPVKAGDNFAVLAEMEQPAYVYVVWIGADGVVEPVYPWWDGEWTKWPVEEPITSLRRPKPVDEFFTLPAMPGMETMVLFARPTPLPREYDLKAELGEFRPQTVEDVTAMAWFENGKLADDAGRKRAGKLGSMRADDPELNTQQRVTEVAARLGFSYTRAVSFANQGK